MQKNGSKLKFRGAQGLLALSPAILFIAVYVGVSLAIGDFYAMPLTVALLAASVWGMVIYRGHPQSGC